MPARGHPPRATSQGPDPPATAGPCRKSTIDIERSQGHGRLESRLRILGVDPGSQATGYGVIDRVAGELRWVAHGVLRPGREASLSARLASLAAELGSLLEEYRPDVASVEGVFVSSSPRSALVLGQARGALLATLGGAAVPLVEYAPARIKQTVSGSGRAAKALVQRMVRRQLALQRTPPSDAADALAAAICHAHAGPLEGLRRPQRRRAVRSPALALRARRLR